MKNIVVVAVAGAMGLAAGAYPKTYWTGRNCDNVPLWPFEATSWLARFAR